MYLMHLLNIHVVMYLSQTTNVASQPGDVEDLYLKSQHRLLRVKVMKRLWKDFDIQAP